MGFIEDNQNERMRFVEQWARYVRKHDDREWSRQQNVIINSSIRSSTMTREEYMKLKDKGFKHRG